MLAAGARPCAGAIIVLVFALAQGVFAAGVAGALAVAGLELLAAAFVLVLGASLLLGLWIGSSAS